MFGQKYAAYDTESARFVFYDSLDSPVPNGVASIAISNEEYLKLLQGDGEGRRIELDANDVLVLVDPLPAMPEQLAKIERHWREERLVATDSMIIRHRDQWEASSITTLTVAQYAELQVYRRDLRDWPEAGAFPLSEHRPIAPSWLADQLK